MDKLTGETFSLMHLGTLVLNKAREIEIVKSMSYTRIERSRYMGPAFIGEINGKPIREYYELPVTPGLLAALGWTIENHIENNIILAWPQKDQFPRPECAHDFTVHFVLEKNALNSFDKGEVVVTDGETGLIAIDDFVDLEHYF